MTVTATLSAKFIARQVGAIDGGSAVFNVALERALAFASGTGPNQADLLYVDERTLDASASEDLDLAGVLQDALGDTLTMAEVVGILVLAEAGNTNNVVIGDATEPVPLFGGTTPTFAVKPGGFFFVAAPGADGLFSVGAGATDDLKVANGGSGTPVTYTVAILGRSA